MIISDEEEKFQLSNVCWICKKLIDHDDEKVRDHCHVNGQFRGATQWSCNINFQLTKKVNSRHISQFKRLRQSFNFQ